MNRMSPESDATGFPSASTEMPPSMRMPFSARIGSTSVSSWVSAGRMPVTRWFICRNSLKPASVPPTDGDAGPPVARITRFASTCRPSAAVMVKKSLFSILAASKFVRISPPDSCTAKRSASRTAEAWSHSGNTRPPRVSRHKMPRDSKNSMTFEGGNAPIAPAMMSTPPK